ncbi:hypothetical protein C8R47DRAFT_1084198 [Mycena vitilis]|nr:hypothetical protein C8R47DRAFT_1084198 [Mycena vitilis]
MDCELLVQKVYSVESKGKAAHCLFHGNGERQPACGYFSFIVSIRRSSAIPGCQFWTREVELKFPTSKYWFNRLQGSLVVLHTPRPIIDINYLLIGLVESRRMRTVGGCGAEDLVCGVPMGSSIRAVYARAVDGVQDSRRRARSRRFPASLDHADCTQELPRESCARRGLGHAGGRARYPVPEMPSFCDWTRRGGGVCHNDAAETHSSQPRIVRPALRLILGKGRRRWHRNPLAEPQIVKMLGRGVLKRDTIRRSDPPQVIARNSVRVKSTRFRVFRVLGTMRSKVDGRDGSGKERKASRPPSISQSFVRQRHSHAKPLALKPRRPQFQGTWQTESDPATYGSPMATTFRKPTANFPTCVQARCSGALVNLVHLCQLPSTSVDMGRIRYLGVAGAVHGTQRVSLRSDRMYTRSPGPFDSPRPNRLAAYIVFWVNGLLILHRTYSGPKDGSTGALRGVRSPGFDSPRPNTKTTNGVFTVVIFEVISCSSTGAALKSQGRKRKQPGILSLRHGSAGVQFAVRGSNPRSELEGGRFFYSRRCPQSLLIDDSERLHARPLDSWEKLDVVHGTQRHRVYYVEHEFAARAFQLNLETYVSNAFPPLGEPHIRDQHSNEDPMSENLDL